MTEAKAASPQPQQPLRQASQQPHCVSLSALSRLPVMYVCTCDLNPNQPTNPHCAVCSRGYVLKPEWMRSVNMQQPVPPREPRTLNVHVYSAFRPQVCVCLGAC